jgi:hypothetical protein
MIRKSGASVSIATNAKVRLRGDHAQTTSQNAIAFRPDQRPVARTAFSIGITGFSPPHKIEKSGPKPFPKASGVDT